MRTLERREGDRLLIAVVVAVAVHAGLYFAIPYVARLRPPQRVYGPLTVTIEPRPLPEPVKAPEEVATVQPEPVRTPAPATAPKPAPAAPALKPRFTERAAARTSSLTPAPSPSIPTAVDPGAPAPVRPSGTSAFRQTGEPTGVSAGTVDESVVVGPQPSLPATTAGPAGDASAGQQRSGAAVTVGGSTSSTASKLDTAKLDRALSSAGGSATASTAGGTPAGGQLGGDIVWEEPGANRDLLERVLPEVPSWVSEQGLSLEVRIRLTVDSNGNVTDARVVQSSGYTDVDEAARDAVRKWRFRSDPGAKSIRGTVPIKINVTR